MRSPLQHRRSTTICVAIALALAACGDNDPAAVTVSFEQPSGGAVVAGGVPLTMAADGLTIEEAARSTRVPATST